jgi:hypothetical protein
VLIGTELAGLDTTQKKTRPPIERRPERGGQSTIDAHAHNWAPVEAILGPVAVALLVALIWIALAVIAVGLVNVAKWIVQTSSRHAVADGLHDDTRTKRRPVMQLEPTTPQR